MLVKTTLVSSEETETTVVSSEEAETTLVSSVVFSKCLDPKDYAAQIRSIKFNLTDEKNADFKQRVLSGGASLVLSVVSWPSLVLRVVS